MRKFSTRASLMALVLALSVSCTAIYRNHGYIPSDDELSVVAVGRDTRDTVAAAVGEPSARGLLENREWYYVQSRWRHYGALPPVEETREVVVVTFDEEGTVQNIERFGLEAGRVVTLSRRVTDSNVKGASFLKQLFGNIGKIDTGELLK